jgi:small subunit ribosomal protein S16
MKRMGRAHRSFFRISAIESRNPRNGRVIEELGWYDPHAQSDENRCKIDAQRVSYWLGVGAQPSKTVGDLLKRQGIAKPQ